MPDTQNGLVRAYTDRSDSVVEVFKEYSDLANSQLHALWFPDEIQVDKDKQCILTEMTPAERHGVITALKLFTMYEVRAGKDYWADRFLQIAKGPEFDRMGAVFSMVERSIHKPFYQKLNDVLGLDTDEFYNSYVDTPVLKARMEFIGEVLNHPNDLVSLGGFSMVEGAILYSTFGYLKHFNANGKNKMKTVGSGINFSVADESLHQQAGAKYFRHLTSDATQDGVYEQMFGDRAEVKATLEKMARTIYEHEAEIIDMLFEKGDLDSLTTGELRVFVQSRLNICLMDLGLDAIFEITEGSNTIADWFYDNINGYQSVDFFSQTGNQYTRKWNEEDFEFKAFEEKEPA